LYFFCDNTWTIVIRIIVSVVIFKRTLDSVVIAYNRGNSPFFCQFVNFMEGEDTVP